MDDQESRFQLTEVLGLFIRLIVNFGRETGYYATILSDLDRFIMIPNFRRFQVSRRSATGIYHVYK